MPGLYKRGLAGRTDRAQGQRLHKDRLTAVGNSRAVFKKALNGEFVPGHFEDFQLPSINELAEQIEKYVQLAIGANLRERTECPE